MSENKDKKFIAAMMFCQMGLIMMTISVSADFWQKLLIEKLNMRHEIKQAIEEDINFYKDSQKRIKNKKKNCNEPIKL